MFSKPKRMKRFLLALFSIFCSLALSAQELSVASFERLDNDIVARSNVEVDVNGNPCAVLRVVVAAEEIDVRGNLGRVGEVINPRPSEYLLYLPEGTRTIYINCSGFLPLIYEVGYRLEGKSSYRLTLNKPQLYAGPVKPQIKTQYVAIKIPTPGATILIDGMPQSISDGAFVGKFALGTHSYLVTAPQYHAAEGEFTLTASARTDLTVDLKPNFGYLDITSSPMGARVIVDGEERGTTPCKVKLRSGAHAIQLLHSGYFAYDSRVTISDGATLPLKSTLKANYAQVTLKAAYPHSEIWMNDKLLGRGEWSGRLDANTYLVECRTEGYETVSDNIEVVAEVSRTYTLQSPAPIYGMVEITSTPYNATIKLDGQVVGTTPWQSNEVLVGRHTLTIEKEHLRYEQDFTLTKEKLLTIDAELNEPLQKYKVGDYYNKNGKEGVVFWVDKTGKHGKIVSMREPLVGLRWCFDSYEQQRLIGANSQSDGAANIAKVKSREQWEKMYPAFKWCADLGEGWYLPAIEELKMFTLDDAVRTAVNKTLASQGGEKIANIGDYHFYWSSTESEKKRPDGLFCAWFVHRYNGDTGYSSKKHYGYVRAVSAF